MIHKNRFCLNQIIAPSMGLREFFHFAASIGIHKVELRNDIVNLDPYKNLRAVDDAKRTAKDLGIKIIAINGIQKFNIAAAFGDLLGQDIELKSLCKAIKCRAIVLCPNNDPFDKRHSRRRESETIGALKTLGHWFNPYGITGLVEPLGYSTSSLSSLLDAQEYIKKLGAKNIRILHDTFHFYIGPDDPSMLGKKYDVKYTGLVHISGVEANMPVSQFRDEHRVLVGPADRTQCKEQIELLVQFGYQGDFSFEACSPAIQKLSKAKLADAIQKSIEFILS